MNGLIEVGCTYVLEAQILFVLREVSLVCILIPSRAICPIFFTLKNGKQKRHEREEQSSYTELKRPLWLNNESNQLTSDEKVPLNQSLMYYMILDS